VLTARPPPGRWLEIADRGRRLRVALADLHAWFQGGEAMLANSRRDAEVLPALRDVLAESSAEFDAAVRDILGAGLGGGDPKRQRRAQAALGLATDFHAWQRLVRCEQLPADEAIEVLARAIEAAAG